MNNKIGYLFSGLAICLFLAGCGNDNQQASTPAEPVPAQQAPADMPAANAPGKIITGKVLESMDASGYTYLKLDQGDKQTWVAIPQASVAVGEEVSVVFSMVMQNFESKTLGKTFDEVIFSSGFAPGSGPSATAGENASASFSDAMQSAGGATADTGGSSKARVPFSELKVEKATGDNAYVVGDLFAQKADLNGKTVRVRGKVMKVSKNIMGKNWIHLQDGSGNPMNNTHDLVVTSSEVPEMDATVTVNGVLTADKDFGAGYKYDVIIEDATIDAE